MKSCRWLILFPYLGLALSVVQAQDIPAYTLSLPPIVIEDPKGDSGLAVELLNEAARRAKVSTVLHVMPWPRAFETARTRPGSLIFPLVKSPEREKDFDWIGPINKVEYYLYKAKTSTVAQVKSLSEIMQSQKVGYFEADVSGSFLKGYANIDGDPSNTIALLIAKLLGGRDDYAVLTPIAAANELKAIGNSMNDVEALFPLNQMAGDGFSYLAMTKGGDEKIVNALRNAFASMLKDGTWDRIYAQYVK